VRDEFMIERHGKQYVLFAGLLDAAHEAGLHSIDTMLLMPPSEGNGWTAIARCVVVMDTSEEPGDRRSFTGIGDASPENVGRNIAPHKIRMAETRAKARALRDAINVGATAFEELGGPENASDVSEMVASKYNPKHNTTAARGPLKAVREDEEDGPVDKATEDQKTAITTMVAQLWPGYELEGMRRILGTVPMLDDLTHSGAEERIEFLLERINEKTKK
jgi:hypothetical protein